MKRIDTKVAISKATNYGMGIDTSTLVIARLASVSVKKLAQGLYDVEANADFRAELVAEMVRERVAKEKEQADKE